MSKKKPARQADPIKAEAWIPKITPFICTLGADLAESKRLAAELQKLREAQHVRPA